MDFWIWPFHAMQTISRNEPSRNVFLFSKCLHPSPISIIATHKSNQQTSWGKTDRLTILCISFEIDASLSLCLALEHVSPYFDAAKILSSSSTHARWRLPPSWSPGPVCTIYSIGFFLPPLFLRRRQDLQDFIPSQVRFLRSFELKACPILTGIIRLCKPNGTGLQSMIGMLYLPNMETRVRWTFLTLENLPLFDHLDARRSSNGKWRNGTRNQIGVQNSLCIEDVPGLFSFHGVKRKISFFSPLSVKIVVLGWMLICT